MSPAERDDEIAELKAKMIRKDFFLMHRKPIASERKAAVALEHFRWLIENEKRGHVAFTGALFDKDGVQREGLTVLRADSWKAAEALAASDPFVTAGAVGFHIERWTLGCGRLTFSVDFSDQSVRLV